MKIKYMLPVAVLALGLTGCMGNNLDRGFVNDTMSVINSVNLVENKADAPDIFSDYVKKWETGSQKQKDIITMMQDVFTAQVNYWSDDAAHDENAKAKEKEKYNEAVNEVLNEVQS